MVENIIHFNYEETKTQRVYMHIRIIIIHSIIFAKHILWVKYFSPFIFSLLLLSPPLSPSLPLFSPSPLLPLQIIESAGLRRKRSVPSPGVM